MAQITAKEADKQGKNLHFQPQDDAQETPFDAAPTSRQRHKPRDPTVQHLPKPLRYSMTPIQFFTYWCQTDKDHPDRTTAYIYRTWPVIDKRQTDQKAYLYVAKETAAYPNSDDWRSEMLHRYGSGNYKLILSDDALSKGIGQTMITDLRDPEYPPVIANLDELVMDDPTNQSYIENLRQKGILPGAEREEDMATGEMVAGLTGTIERLSNRLTEKKEAATVPTASATDAAKETVAMAREVFKEGIELGKATSAAQADAQVAAAKSGQQDTSQTLGLIRQVADLLRTNATAVAAPPATGMGEAVAQIATIYNGVLDREAKLHGTIMSMMESRVQGLERLIQDRSANPATATVPKDDLISSLEKLAGMKDKLQNLFGGGDSEDKEEKVPAWMNLAQSAMSALPTAATALLAMSYNMAVAKTGSGTPIPPATEVPSLPPVPDNLNPTAGEKPMAASVYATFLSQIERPLINHLNDPSKTGADFADWVSSGFGDIGYQAAKELGKDTLLALLSSRPSIASVIQQIPERTAQFLDEFLNADEEDDEGAGDVIDVSPGEFMAPAEMIDVPPIVQARKPRRAKPVTA